MGLSSLLLTNVLVPASSRVSIGMDIGWLRHSPLLGVVVDKLLHQIFTFGGIDVDNLNASLLEVIFATNKSLVLAEHNTLDLVQDTGSSTHVTGRKSRVHSSALVGRSWEPTSILKSTNLCLFFLQYRVMTRVDV